MMPEVMPAACTTPATGCGWLDRYVSVAGLATRLELAHHRCVERDHGHAANACFQPANSCWSTPVLGMP